MKFTYKKITKVEESEQCDVVFVVSSGVESVPYFTEEFTKKTKVITILGSTVENRNKFHSNAIIQMPINGSKIFDAIIDMERPDQQSEYLLRCTNSIVHKFNANILVAEDNTTNQKLVKTLLSKHGITVDIADNGKIALEKYTNNITNNVSNYDLIFLDIHMPIMDGIESIQKIRDFENKNKMIPMNIVALTADAIKTHQQHYLEVEFNDFLAKPIEKIKFEKALNKYLASNLIQSVSTIESGNSSIPTSPATNNEKEIINRSENKIKKVCENLGLDEETVSILMDDFMENWIIFEEKLKIAIDELQLNEIREISHSLKGAAGSLMLEDVYNLCKELEDLSKKGNIEDKVIYKELLNQIKQKIEE